MKIRPVEAKLFHADGRTDRYTTKLIVAFRSFVKAPKNDKYMCHFSSCSSVGTVSWCHVACVEVMSHAIISSEVC